MDIRGRMRVLVFLLAVTPKIMVISFSMLITARTPLLRMGIPPAGRVPPASSRTGV